MCAMAHKHVRDEMSHLSMPLDVSVILHSGRDSLNRQRKNISRECAENELAGP
jgi:hypothetical protein